MTKVKGIYTRDPAAFADAAFLPRLTYTEVLEKRLAVMDATAFTLAMENEIMGKILNDGQDPNEAALAWLKANPDAVTPWLAGVTAKDGGDAVAAVTAALK